MNAVVPTRTRPARLAPLAKLPIFLDLAGRRVVLAGGGEPAVWKAELLLAAGAALDVYASDPAPDLAELAEGADGRLRLHPRDWRPEDLEGAALVVAELDATQAAPLRAAARARNLLVNVIDLPAACDFQFGAIVNRSPVVVGIMTDGAAPILGQAIRRRIEALLPPWLGAWGRVAKGFRGRLATLLAEKGPRRAFWERFVDEAWARPPGPDTAALARLEGLAELVDAEGAGRSGEVVLVGAGPGDPDLLTLKAVREMGAADVIVHDRLVTPAVLELARREAQRVYVGKEGHGAACRQEDISALLVDLALAGKRVVRLKGGDPALFGRTGEEVAACRAAGIPVRIVPGVTTASAAAASLGLSLTHRDHARRVEFVTGHDRRGELPDDLDLDRMADPRATLVVYMGRRTIATLAGKLLEKGLAPDTPAVALADVSRPDEEAVRTDLAALAGDALPPFAGRPVLILIGSALGEPATPISAAIAAERALAL
ncbi:MAG: uroporphyrinogen-III C-methyltransferase [Methylobacteriaceae bacterium]|nr:uroporphyrinogen-III C-methyltransferase [Methylobacteriaceae bacterium]